MPRIGLLATLLSLALVGARADDFLPPEQAFSMVSRADHPPRFVP